MSNTDPTASKAHRSIRCTFGPVRELDLVWPPADEDIDAFTVVRLDEGDTLPPRFEPPLTEPLRAEPAGPRTAGAWAAKPEPVGPEPARPGPRLIKTTFGDCRSAAVRVRQIVVPIEPPPLPGPAVPDTPAVTPPPVAAPEEVPKAHVPARDRMAASAKATPLTFRAVAPPPDPETAGAGRSAWLAVFFAAACALVGFAEYRRVSTPVDGPEAPPVPAQVSVANVPAPDARAVPPSAASKPAQAERTAAAAPVRPTPEPTPERTPRLAVATLERDVEPVGPVTPRVTVDVQDRGVVPAKVEPRATPTVRTELPPALAARVEVPPPTPTLPPPVAAAVRPEPLAKATPSPPAMSTPVAAVLADSASDEADIQSTLTRFRTAYSQLNASAARDVWPSVDARALERAFHSLKSQDLRFDSCTMTVTGARAQAACKGRAVYVPRIGDQSPRFTSREWNFELRKADERWTIASARSL